MTLRWRAMRGEGRLWLLGAWLTAAALGCDAGSPASAPGRAAAVEPAALRPPAFLKGQLHAHSSRSHDSETPPEEVAAFYSAHGYDFVVFTDHNWVTAPKAAAPGGLLAIPGVELTQNLWDCDPPPPRPDFGCLLHVNALFVDDPGAIIAWGPPPSLRRVDLYGRAVDRALALGGIAQLNHPNFQRGADLEVLVALAKRGLTLVEIANQAVDSDNEGDAAHPSTEALWDAALAQGARVYGTASDDAHHYGDAARLRARGRIAYEGDLGFVMVRAARDAASLRAAIARGDFYSSTGVYLDRLELSPAGIAVDVRPEGGAAGADLPLIQVIANGSVVAEAKGPTLRFDPRLVPPGYLRVRILDGKGRRAWTQPLWTKS